MATRKGVAREKLGVFVRKTLVTIRVEMGKERRGATTRPCTDCAAELGRFGVNVDFQVNGLWTTKRADLFKQTKGETRPKRSRQREIASYKANR